MKEIYLVTGATGFVGSCLVHKLVDLNKEVHIISRKTHGNWRLEDIKGKIQIHYVNLVETKLQKLLEKIKPMYVFHLAAYGSLPEEDKIENMINTNILGTINLVRSLNFRDVKLFINTSTSAEYAIQDRAYKETDPIGPINDYGFSKASQTFFCQKEALRNNLPIITFRLFSVYGDFEEKTRLIPQIILNALGNKDIALSNKTFVRDFVFIDDVIDAYLLACSNIPKPGEIFNIGTGRQHTIEEVVRLVLRLTKSDSKALWGVIEKQKRQIEPKTWRANNQRAKKSLGWKPKYNLEKGLSETIAWFRNNQSLYA